MCVPQAWYKRKEHGSMTRKRVGRDLQEYPISKTVRWPAGNSDKIDMQLSHNSMQQDVPVINNDKNQPPSGHVKRKIQAYKSDFLVQPKHLSQNKHSKC